MKLRITSKKEKDREKAVYRYKMKRDKNSDWYKEMLKDQGASNGVLVIIFIVVLVVASILYFGGL